MGKDSITFDVNHVGMMPGIYKADELKVSGERSIVTLDVRLTAPIVTGKQIGRAHV